MVRLSLSNVMVRPGSAPRVLLLDEAGHLGLQVPQGEREPDPLGQVRGHGVGLPEDLADAVQDREIGLVHRFARPRVGALHR